ncbi:MAG: heme o synthase [Alphaproteobacteria bacterium]|nr:heme o synthase [Alphaproteobacteria bacterium]MDX5367825.1 heme o synthase [Alphaproteobacteria bacterium]
MSDTALDISRDQAHDGFSSASDLFQLLKPRVMSLVVFTALVGIVLAPGDLHPILGFTALLCIAVGAGASGALNMWYDADIDAVMRRTRTRPIPRGAVTASEALALGIALSGGSVLLLGLAVNWLAAGLLAFTIFFYAVIYTMWLKRWTPQNIVIGGAAGALPPMIGWAAVTGTVTVEPVVLFAIIFLWTPPHFWALSLYKAEEYAGVGVPMLPVVAGKAATRRQILLYSLVMAPVTLLPWWLGFAGPVYGVPALVLNAIFIGLAAKLWRGGDAGEEPAAKRLFAFSILYLFILYALLLVEGMTPSLG